MPFKVVMRYPDGTSEADDELFETYEEAQAHGSEQVNNYAVGGDVLHMSNPGDYPPHEAEDDADFDVIEVDA